jgi:general secretion pathway protein N
VPAPAPPAPSPPGDTQGDTQADPAANPSPLLDKEEYASVKDRPLFRPDRRPRIDDPEAARETAAEALGELKGMDLTGVLISPTVVTAWVRDPGQPASVRLRLGETLAGWTVQDIKTDRVVLERQGKTDTLILRDFHARGAPAPPATPPTQRPSAAVRQAPAGTQRGAPAAQGRAVPGQATSPAGQPPAATQPGVPTAGSPGAAAAPESKVKGRGTGFRPPAGNPNARPDVR